MKWYSIRCCLVQLFCFVHVYGKASVYLFATEISITKILPEYM